MHLESKALAIATKNDNAFQDRFYLFLIKIFMESRHNMYIIRKE